MRARSPRDRVQCVRQKTAGDDLAGLLIRVAAQDRSAFAQLYAATSAKLHVIILRIVQRRDLADDVMQDAYLRVWTCAAKYRPEVASPLTWMAIIARNLAIDELRKKSTLPLDGHPEVAKVKDGDDPLHTVEQNDSRRHLLKCIKLLAPEKREVVLLAYFHGMTGEEISARIGRPVSTVKTFLRRSLMRLGALQRQIGPSVT